MPKASSNGQRRSTPTRAAKVRAGAPVKPPDTGGAVEPSLPPRQWRSRIVGHGEEDAEQLLANPANWRIHPKAQQDALEGVLSEVGWVQDVVVNQRTGHVVDGHLRVSLAISKGERVPVVYVDLDEREEALILATIDPLSAMAATDGDKLRELVADLHSDNGALEALLHGSVEQVGAVEGEDDAPEAPIAPVTILGDLWRLGEHRVLCGDSTSIDDVERLLGGQKADMVFTDPPYGVGFQSGMSKGGTATRFDKLQNDDRILDIAPVIWIAMAEDSAAFVWTCHQVYPKWREQFEQFYKSTIIWHKPGGGIGDLEGDYATDYEMCLFCVKGRPTFRGKRGMAVWTVSKDRVEDYVHPTQKPVELSARAINDFTDSDALVLDLFGGSGSTLIGCEKTGRSGRLMELDPKYVDVIVTRWQDFTGKKATLEATGETFEQVKFGRRLAVQDALKEEAMA